METYKTPFKRPVFSVSRVNDYAKSLLHGDPFLQDIWVQGEISNLKRHSSGHVYFTVKDSDASLKCAFFRQNAMRCGIRLAEGAQVTLNGYITIYTRDGSYQMVVERAESDGEGALFALFRRLKEKLEDKGYFNPEIKKPLPFFPRKIAVVTSPTGAAVRDIIRVARSRYPGIEILIFPASVQGEGSAEQIAAAINLADKSGAEVIIAGRGGGSLEDLWAFNEEIVAEAVFRCKTPIISAVGHETDFTIADFCADVRASTPTHAAELCVPDALQISAAVRSLSLRAKRIQKMRLDALRERLERLRERPVLRDHLAFISLRREKIALLKERICRAAMIGIGRERARATLLREKAEALSPFGVLGRGYAIVKSGEKIITSAAALEGDVSIVMRDGSRKARVLDE